MPTNWSRPSAAAILGCLTFLLIGWSGLLIPTLIRSIEGAFAQDDAALGGFFFVLGIGYGAGVLGGAVATERIGRRPILVGATLLLAIGLVVLATTGSWLVFVLGGIPLAVGQGALDGGGNGLILDLFRDARGRALNLLHLAFSVGALACPLVVGTVVGAGIAWPVPLLLTGLVALPIAVGLAFAAMPTGRPEERTDVRAAPNGGSERSAANAPRSGTVLRDLVLLGLAGAIATYVSAEVGVSDWLVRFLHEAPLSTATTALTLYWAGIAVGRLGGARIGDRLDHRTFAMLAAIVMAAFLAAGVVAPTIELSMAAFALAGVASGPIFPLVVALGGERHPERSAAIGGYFVAAAVVGGVSYPALMGLLSTTVGLPIAMLGTAALGLACGSLLWAVGRARTGTSLAAGSVETADGGAETDRERAS
jgi:fucose permease